MMAKPVMARLMSTAPSSDVETVTRSAAAGSTSDVPFGDDEAMDEHSSSSSIIVTCLGDGAEDAEGLPARTTEDVPICGVVTAAERSSSSSTDIVPLGGDDAATELLSS